MRGILRCQPPHTVAVLAEGEGRILEAGLGILARSLDLGRELSPQERGIVRDEARVLDADPE